jgi:hypothetical protein
MAAGKQHHLEFGGSPVGVEFDGSLHFRLAYRIPHISVSQDFTEQTARQIRYALVATVGPERPFYHRYYYVVLDVRMIGNWEPGSEEFVQALRERLRGLGGELFLVADRPVPLPDEFPRYASPEEALEAARELRAQHRQEKLGSAGTRCDYSASG